MGKSDYTVYHNSRCSKSRCALTFLDDKKVDFEVVEYLKNPLNATQLKELLKKLDIPASELIRKGEPEYKEYYHGKELDESQWIDAMVQYPKLIERPIIVKGARAVIGRPTERIEEL